MDNKEFSQIRHVLSRTQNQLARLLCVSPKAIQSFEQGWRRIPTYIEREILLLLSLKKMSSDKIIKPCWEIKNCPSEWREKCFLWELKAVYFCWFITGTFCQGRLQENWKKKHELCQECEVYQSMIPKSL